MRDVVIQGDGVAASCCAYLLGKAGFRVALKPVERPRLPVIMLGDHALALIRDIFDRQDLFRDMPRIESRVVAWGAGSKAMKLEHSAVVVSEELLLQALRPPSGDEPIEADWTIFASRPLPAPVVEHRFGSRMAAALPIQLRAGADSSACWIESLEEGWLFLIPNAPGSGWLLSVGNGPETLLSKSRVISEQISEYGQPTTSFPPTRALLSHYVDRNGWPAERPPWHSILFAGTALRTRFARRSWRQP